MRELTVVELIEVLEGLEVSMFNEVEIVEIEDRGPLRVMYLEDTVVITNDPTYPGVQLWPTP